MMLNFFNCLIGTNPFDSSNTISFLLDRKNLKAEYMDMKMLFGKFDKKTGIWDGTVGTVSLVDLYMVKMLVSGPELFYC